MPYALQMNGASQGTIICVNVAGIKNIFIMPDWYDFVKSISSDSDKFITEYAAYLLRISFLPGTKQAER
jgi:hypothetical protein